MEQRNFVVFAALAFLFPIVFSTPSLIASHWVKVLNITDNKIQELMFDVSVMR